MPDDALMERLWDAIFQSRDLDTKEEAPTENIVAAVLPIIAAEVRKAKAEALRKAALQYGPAQLTGIFSRDGYTRAWLNARATEYETGAEHDDER